MFCDEPPPPPPPPAFDFPFDFDGGLPYADDDEYGLFESYADAFFFPPPRDWLGPPSEGPPSHL